MFFNPIFCPALDISKSSPNFSCNNYKLECNCLVRSVSIFYIRLELIKTLHCTDKVYAFFTFNILAISCLDIVLGSIPSFLSCSSVSLLMSIFFFPFFNTKLPCSSNSKSDPESAWKDISIWKMYTTCLHITWNIPISIIYLYQVHQFLHQLSVEWDFHEHLQ